MIHFRSSRSEAVSSNDLFLPVDPVHTLLLVHHLFHLLYSALVGVDASEVRGAPHLVGVELVGAAELVAVVLLVHAVKELVLRLEAELAVELVGVEVAQQVELVVTQIHFII